MVLVNVSFILWNYITEEGLIYFIYYMWCGPPIWLGLIMFQDYNCSVLQIEKNYNWWCKIAIIPKWKSFSEKAGFYKYIRNSHIERGRKTKLKEKEKRLFAFFSVVRVHNLLDSLSLVLIPWISIPMTFLVTTKTQKMNSIRLVFLDGKTPFLFFFQCREYIISTCW